MSLNRICLIGRMTKDPDLSYTPQGVAVAKFTLAVDRNTKADDEGKKECDFINCLAWRHSAEFCGNYLGKGRLVAVAGRLQIRKYQDQGGTTKYFTEVVCDEVLGLDRPKDDGQGAGVAPTTDDDPFAGQ
ncbi:MAG TPA: single-stranded DNA-binding protein [Candidatus Rokubacteria bacterium]|nr:single-stranded DNA-binding protein [Candidatus Rokubacteria bacterium]